MSQVIFISHLPYVRMHRQDDFPISSGWLTKLPWEQFNDLTQGAFDDWRPKYIETDPVFFWHQQDMDLPFVRQGNVEGMEEIKLTNSSFRTALPKLGFEVVADFHEQLVDPVWAAAALSAPACLPPAPDSSVTFFMAAGENYFEIGNRTMHGARIQGEADQEMVYLANGASEPFDDTALEHWAQTIPLAKFALQHKDIWPSLQLLQGAANLTLSASEQLLLCVAALESLLLPDVTVNSGSTFARRLSNLLAKDTSHQTTLFETARSLYRYRSAVLHADQKRIHRIQLAPATAEQLLAATIVAAAKSLSNGSTIEQFREQLDDCEECDSSNVNLPLAQPPGRASTCRLGPRKAWCAATLSSTGSLSSPEKTVQSWSPLIGFHHEKDTLSHSGLGVHLLKLDAAAIVSMEEKDIRRDFISSLRVGSPVTVLSSIAPHERGLLENEHIEPLTRRRDLAVVGMRLIRLVSFIDPELLGSYVYQGNLRHRKETVLRQTILMALNSTQPDTVETASENDLMATWSLLSEYEHLARDKEVDRILDLFRHIHDRRYLPIATRASLTLICLESLLGRFPKYSATVQLEDLVAELDNVSELSVAWFQAHGRTFRNAIAHGKWNTEPIDIPEVWYQDHEPIMHFQEIARAAVATMLKTWINVDSPVRAHHGCKNLLVRTLRKRVQRSGANID